MNQTNNLPSKTCCRCKISKTIDNYAKAAKSKYGVHAICKECKKLYMKAYKDSGKLRISVDKYHSKPETKEHRRQYRRSLLNKNAQRRYRLSEKGLASCRAKLVRYRYKLNSGPFYSIYKEEIKIMYRNCPQNHQVDHIIPLQGDNVCGLHVPWNLQYLKTEDNKLKNNKFDGTYDNKGWSNI